MAMKHQYPKHVTLTTLPVRGIYHYIQRFCQLHPLPKRRARPYQYPEALILTLLLLRIREHASYRRLLFGIAPELLSEFDLPALGTLVYRFHHLQQERLQQLLTWLAQQGIA
ncbi:MAG: hypothetical protein K6U75_17020 [Firmicutes bacterium]|nr:hypothetical protein [Bacillota bacterium]